MANPKQQVTFGFKELAEVLVREAKVNSGHWGIFVRFGLAATNVGETPEELRPPR
jgi:hypothetical protein